MLNNNNNNIFYIYSQAYATRQDISRQGRMLQNVNSRVTGVIGKFFLCVGLP